MYVVPLYETAAGYFSQNLHNVVKSMTNKIFQTNALRLVIRRTELQLA